MSNANEYGYVYVMKNKLFPSLVKIGCTSRTPDERSKDFGTGLPEPWEVVCAVYLKEYKQLEKTLHHLFISRRLRNNREFFFFDYDVEPDKNDLVLLFDFLAKSASKYEIDDATQDVKDVVESLEKKIDKNVVFVLKKNNDVVLKATFDIDSKEFVFDRDVYNIGEPSFTDTEGGALSSTKRKYEELRSSGLIDIDGTFKLSGVGASALEMSSYTKIILNNSVNWKYKWVTEDNKTYNDFINNQ
jgi:hypothetical protein